MDGTYEVYAGYSNLQNQLNIKPLLQACSKIQSSLGELMHFIFVVDGSPDDSGQILKHELPTCDFHSRLLFLSRNFGSFQAIQAGLNDVTTEFAAVMAADLQEPPELVVEFFRALIARQCEIAVGVRMGRHDPRISQLFSRLFWGAYRSVIHKRIPKGGVDVFGLAKEPLKRLIEFSESNSSLVGLLMWMGFNVKEFPYDRRRRELGVSTWTMAKKFKYLSDSVFAFSDLPIRFLYMLGFTGIGISFLVGAVVLVCKLVGLVTVPGYTATILLICFLGSLNLFGLATIGSYTWRTYENTKARPRFLVAKVDSFSPVVLAKTITPQNLLEIEQ